MYSFIYSVLIQNDTYCAYLSVTYFINSIINLAGLIVLTHICPSVALYSI